MAVGGKRAAAQRGSANLQNMQQMQLQFNPTGELKAVSTVKDFSISECADDWNNYGFGSIVRIRLINFQKYSDCIIRPGPYMNMLIGPNGTGKSTVVAAIALGLGANPATIGRSKNPLEFIKYYCSTATIEIIIKCVHPGEEKSSNGRPYIVFKRNIRRRENDECQSDFFINNEISNAKQVLLKAQELGVQVDNLCQFLPQDRVSEFAQMTPEKMLEQTMEAAATPETSKQFKELVKIKKEEKELTDSLKNDRSELDNDQRIMANLQSIRLRAKEREERRKKIEIMKRKRPWLIYQEARNNFMELKVTRDRLKAELEAATVEADQELNSQIEEVEANLKASSRKLKQLAQKVKGSRQEIHQVHAEASQIAAVIAARKTEIREKRNFLLRTREKYEKDRKELRETEEAIARFEEEHANNSATASIETIDRDLNAFNAELGEIERKASDLHVQMDDITTRSAKLRDAEVKARSKIDEIRNLRNRRLDTLARMNKVTFTVYEWLEKNRHRFRGNIAGPIALDLKVKDDKMAQAVESVISRSILVSFVCDNVQDYDTFSAICEEMGWTSINSVLLENYHGEQTPMPQCPWTKKELKSLGFDCVVSELLEAPHMILWALHELSKIHLIPVCLSDRGSAAIDIVGCESNRLLMKFLSKESFFEIKRSRYNDADVATKSSQLKPGFILTQDAGVSSANIEELQGKIDEIRSRLDREQIAMKSVLERISAVDRDQNKVKQKIETAQELKKAGLVIKAELRRKELHRERLRRDVKESHAILQNESDEGEMLRDLTEKFHERAEMLKNLEGLMQNFQEIVRIAGIQELSHRVDTLRLKQLEALRSQQEGQHANLRRRVEMAEIDVQRAKERARDTLAVAEMDQITAEMKEAFAGLTDSLDELNNQILSEETLFNAGGSGERFGQQDLDQLARRENSIRTREEKIQVTQKEIEKLQSKMTEIGSVWRASVDQMIAAINEKFEAFFRKISCQGQVRLGVPPDATDFDQYSLAIYVKFRASEELQRLTGMRQSGGEKSVSTILYLLSLQELSRAPFRVVDEINQGMDVENERKVHALMVETATRMDSKRAQYFLITPKLLTGLEYNDKMHILCIFNGKKVLK